MRYLLSNNVYFSSHCFLKIHSKMVFVPQNNCARFKNSSYNSKVISSRSIVSYESLLSTKDDKYTKEDLHKELIPKHVALIIDGNRRWLEAQGKPLDYRPFFEVNALFADLCLKWGVGTATTFIYSYDNLKRGQVANNLIFRQLENFLRNYLDDFVRKNVKVLMMGERELLPKSLQDMIKEVEDATNTTNTQLVFRLAVCYSGTRDILQATRSLCEKAKAGLIEPSAIDDATFDRELWAGGAPTPELLIRTGGQLRLSNYLVWHLAQAEFYFLPIYGPEFTEVHFLNALRSFQKRNRNGGK